MPNDGGGEGDVCIANIGPRERRKRMTFGVIAFGVGVVACVALVATGVSRWWRLGLFLPLWAAGLGVFQAREKT
jgi:hypothetical protein